MNDRQIFEACYKKCLPHDYRLTTATPHHTLYICFEHCGAKLKQTQRMAELIDKLE